MAIPVMMLLALISSPQELQRARLTGRAIGLDDKPWANAEVHLVSRPWQSIGDLGPLDSVTTKTDERGRFRARILAGRTYAAWATSEGRISELREDIIAQRPLRLVERESKTKQIEVRGMDRWEDHGPLRFELRWESDIAYAVPLQLADGKLAIPPQPCGFEISATSPTGALAGRASSSESRLQLERPLETRIHVTSKNGDAIAGATIWAKRSYSYRAPSATNPWRFLPPRWVRVGTSDAKGTSTVVRQSSANEITVAAPGHELGWSRRVTKKHTFKLAPKADLRGKLIGLDGEPRAGAQLLVFFGSVVSEGEGRSRRGIKLPKRRLVTAADGTFAMEGLSDESHVRIEAYLPELGSPNPAVLVCGVAGKLRSDPVVIDLRELKRVEFTLQGEDGTPAAQALLVLRSQLGSGHDIEEPILGRSDRRGRVALVLPPRELDVLAVSRSTGYALSKFDPSEQGELSLVLKPFREVRIKVVDDAQKPIADAGVRTSGGSYSHTGALYAEAYDWNTSTLRGKTNANGVRIAQLIEYPNQSYSVTSDFRGQKFKIRSDSLPEEVELTGKRPKKRKKAKK